MIINKQLIIFRHYLVFILFLLFLTACNKDTPFPRCIQADDFNTLNLTISAHAPEGSDVFIADNKESGDGFNPDQVTRWRDTGFVTTGETLIIRTEGMWTAWLDDGNTTHTTSSSTGDKFSTESKYDSEISLSKISQDRVCGPYSQKAPTISGCSAARTCPYVELGKPADNAATKQYGPPCWFNNGYGAYILLQRDGDPDPNMTLDSMRYPESPIVHIGYDNSKGEQAFSSLQHPIIDQSCTVVNIEKGWKIYAKILDRFYWNDAGGYAIEFLKGARSTENRQILEDIRKSVQDILISSAEKIFKHVTQDNQYINFVKALLVLYIAFSGITYMFGMAQQAFPDVMIRIIKIAIVMQLISPSSWDFFYGNLAILYVEGTTQIIGLINSHSGVEFDPNAPFGVFDRMLDTLFSGTVWRAKAIGFIWSKPPVVTCLILLVIIIIIIFYTLIMIYACIIYLTSLMGIAILISLMPIFFLTILFSKLSQTFEKWLTQAASFAFQSIMIFTVVSMFSVLVMKFYYRTFGFTTCYNEAFQFKFCLVEGACIKISSINTWTFGSKFDPYEFGFFAENDFSLDNRVTFTRGKAIIKVPPDYKIDDERYLDYPFFDPSSDIDKDIIEKKIKKGYFFVAEDLFSMVLLTILLWHLRLFVQRIGASIAGGSPYITVVGQQYENFFQDRHGVLPYGNTIAKLQSSVSFMYQKFVSAVPGTIARSVPGGERLMNSGLAKGIKSAANVAEWAAGAESDIKREYRERDAFKWIHHKQAVIGQTLSNISPDNLVKSGLSYGYNKALGKTSEGLGGHIKTSYAQQLEKLHDNILGYKRPSAPKHEDNPDDDANPFQREGESASEDLEGQARSGDVSESSSDIGSNVGEEVIREFERDGEESLGPSEGQHSVVGSEGSETIAFDDSHPSDLVNRGVESDTMDAIKSAQEDISPTDSATVEDSANREVTSGTMDSMEMASEQVISDGDGLSSPEAAPDGNIPSQDLGDTQQDMGSTVEDDANRGVTSDTMDAIKSAQEDISPTDSAAEQLQSATVEDDANRGVTSDAMDSMEMVGEHDVSAGDGLSSPEVASEENIQQQLDVGPSQGLDENGTEGAGDITQQVQESMDSTVEDSSDRGVTSDAMDSIRNAQEDILPADISADQSQSAAVEDDANRGVTPDTMDSMEMVGEHDVSAGDDLPSAEVAPEENIQQKSDDKPSQDLNEKSKSADAYKEMLQQEQGRQHDDAGGPAQQNIPKKKTRKKEEGENAWASTLEDED